MVREMLSDIKVARWLQCATNEMLQNSRTDIRFSCRRCKVECVTEPDSGILEKHLKRNGLMDGYTWWISDQEDDVNGGAPGNEEGQPDEDQDAGHENQDAGHEDSSWVRDPHVQALLVK